MAKFEDNLPAGGNGFDVSLTQNTLPELAGNTDAISIYSPELMFTGEYFRDGDDLLITLGLESIVIADYFASNSAPTLVAPNGATLEFDVVSALAGEATPVQYAQSSGETGGPLKIGEVIKLEGTADSLQTGGSKTELKLGDPVFQGDVVSTGAGSKMGISFSDGTLFSLSENARIVLNELIYNPNQSDDNSMVFNLVQGTFVFAAGALAKSGDMKIDTPVGTMGIRGTTPMVTVSALLGTAEFSILPDPADGAVGSYVVISKTTGDVVATVETVGTKWVMTSLSQEAVPITKSGIDLLEDKTALDEIREVFSLSLGDQGFLQGANSFEQVAFNSLSSGLSDESELGNGSEDSGGAEEQQGGGASDKDDPPIAGDDAFATDEETVLTGENVINGSDIDPDGFALTVVAVNNGLDGPLIFVAGFASVDLPSGAKLNISPTGDIEYNANDAYEFLGLT